MEETWASSDVHSWGGADGTTVFERCNGYAALCDKRINEVRGPSRGESFVR